MRPEDLMHKIVTTVDNTVLCNGNLLRESTEVFSPKN